jgi:hypothetical protein
MDKIKLDKILEDHKAWLAGSGGARAVLSRADLSHKYLPHVNLSRANLSGANLVGAYLSCADLRRANLSGANLRKSNLSGATLRNANLKRASLVGANLFDADLNSANLTKCNLAGADLTGTGLLGAILPGYNGIEPESLEDALNKTRDWLASGHWTQDDWINTPDGAYSGTCLACLHGAANYVGGKFGGKLNKLFNKNGYTIDWNDERGRTLGDVIKALDSVGAKI